MDKHALTSPDDCTLNVLMTPPQCSKFRNQSLSEYVLLYQTSDAVLQTESLQNEIPSTQSSVFDTIHELVSIAHLREAKRLM